MPNLIMKLANLLSRSAPLLLCLLILPLVPGAASAQTATLTGRVTAADRRPIGGVTVTASQLQGSGRTEAVSDADGVYSIVGLTPGSYQLIASGSGFQDTRIDEVRLQAGMTVNVPIEMRVYSLQGLVVTASTTNAAITADEIEQWQATDLADVFRTVPSVSVGGSLGLAQKIYLRGVEDTQLNVSVDGAMLTGTLFHHIGRVTIDPELLERVEVQAGAGEATAGFGALGGAIRFRTKDPEDLLAPEQRMGAMARGGYFTNDGYRTSLSAYGRLNDGWSVLGSYVLVDRDDAEDGGGDRQFGTAAEQNLGFLKLQGRLSDSQTLTLSYEQRDEEGEFGQRPNWPVMAGEPLFPGVADRRTGVANYALDLNGLVSLEATAYATRSGFEQNRHDRWGRYGAEMNTWGFDLRNTSSSGRHELIYGVEHRDDEVVSEYREDPSVWADWAWDANVGHFRETGDVWGLYLQDHIRLAAPLLLSLGLRYDAYSMKQVTYDDGTSSSGFSGNLGVRYEPVSNLAISAGVAQAMRGKEVGDAFTLERRPQRISIDPALDPERVTNTELGTVFDDGRWFASASVYRMTIDDVIQDQLGNGPEPQEGVYYENVGELETEGFEIGAGYAAERIRGRLFFTTFDARLNGNVVEGYEQIGLANASGDKWDLTLTFLPMANLEMSWNSTVVEPLEDIEVLHRAVEIGWIEALQTVDKPGYDVHDVSLRWRPLGGDRLTLDLAVQNLFDEHYRDHSSVADYNAIAGWEGVAGLYEVGRDIRLSVGTRF